MKYLASALDALETAKAMETAKKHGAKTPLLTGHERDKFSEFSGQLRLANPALSELLTQHLSCMGDCLRDVRKDLKVAERSQPIWGIVCLITFFIGFVVGRL